MDTANEKIICVYDGACPLCTHAAVTYKRATLEGDVRSLRAPVTRGGHRQAYF